MKSLSCYVSCLIACVAPVMADPASKLGGMNQKPSSHAGAPEYRAESPLPEGWPQPGPFNLVVRKKYPAYRAAFTSESSPNGGFWRLFKHIERNKIPMTAPVEMKLDAAEAASGKMEEMAFLYQNKGVGETGADEGQVEVRDVPARDTISYAWQGPRNVASIAKARAAIDAELARQNLKADGYRLLGYNSPFVPQGRQTHELQALLP
jgi:hypothetical protein